MKNWSLCTTFLAAALLSAAAHATDRSVHSTQDIAAGGRLVVRNVAGSVTVERGSSGMLELNGEVEEGADLQLKGSPAERTIEVVQPKQSKETLNADLHIRVAAGVALDIETVSADVLVHAMEGTVTVRTVSGGVRMDVASTAVELRTVSGDIELHAPSAKTSLQTVSGNVTADGVRREVDAESVSGDVNLRVDAARHARVKTVSGDVTVEALLEGDGRVSVESLSGDLHVQLPAKTSAELTAHTFSGEVASEFGGTVSRRGDELKQTIGDGKGRIELQTFSGDVRVLKR